MKTGNQMYRVTMSVIPFVSTEWSVGEVVEGGATRIIAQGVSESFGEAAAHVRETLANEWIKGDHDDI